MAARFDAFTFFERWGIRLLIAHYLRHHGKDLNFSVWVLTFIGSAIFGMSVYAYFYIPLGF